MFDATCSCPRQTNQVIAGFGAFVSITATEIFKNTDEWLQALSSIAINSDALRSHRLAFSLNGKLYQTAPLNTLSGQS